MTQGEIKMLAAAIAQELADSGYGKDVLTIDEAARYTGLSRSTLYKINCAGQIPYGNAVTCKPTISAQVKCAAVTLPP